MIHAEDGVVYLTLDELARRSPTAILADRPEFRVLWVQTQDKPSLIKALEAGFKPATPLDGAKPILVFTRFMMKAAEGVR